MLQAGLLPDLVTVTIVLPACSTSASLACGRGIHGYMVVSGMADRIGYSGFDETLVKNAVMDMYVKCGNLTDALSVFKSMVNKDVASWNIMIMGYGMQGYGSEAVDFFKMMCEEKIKPDEASFVAVLSACSHAGLVDKGRELLSRMVIEYGIAPTRKHYACIVDMLGRANCIEEAYEVASTMLVEANPVIWRSLLSACHLHGNARIAQLASRKVAELDPAHCGSYVLISNACLSSGRYEEVVDVRRMMRERRVRKIQGRSSCV
ncbi:hypothetical protein MLD38_039963 [Melastoma candidum]|nr:hypothetical protein MLD38_039963 [Melastoma candidum]